MKLRDQRNWQNHYNDISNHVGECVGCPEGRDIEATSGLSTVQDLVKRPTLETCSHHASNSIARYKAKDDADQVFKPSVGEYAKIQRQIGDFGAGDSEFVRNLVQKEELTLGCQYQTPANGG